MKIEVIGVVGAGQMGSGIAEVALTSGLRVVMMDVAAEALERGENRIGKDLQRRVDEGKMGSNEKSEILERLTVTTQLGDLEVCDFVVEAATEKVALKQEIFKGLDQVAPKGVILATNTSSISITRMASFTARPDWVIGMHFFNPVPVMNLIEIVRGMETSDETYMTTRTLSERFGKTPLEARDMPGFVSSRLIFSYMNEAIYSLYEGVGSREDIDAIMKMGANHPMGPLALADFVGLDTVLSVMKILQEAFGDKYRPCPLLVKYVEAGHLGVKSGRGFYEYGDKR